MKKIKWKVVRAAYCLKNWVHESWLVIDGLSIIMAVLVHPSPVDVTCWDLGNTERTRQVQVTTGQDNEMDRRTTATNQRIFCRKSFVIPIMTWDFHRKEPFFTVLLRIYNFGDSVDICYVWMTRKILNIFVTSFFIAVIYLILENW